MSNFFKDFEGVIETGSKFLIHSTSLRGLTMRADLDVNQIPHNPMNVMILGVSVRFYFLLGRMQVTLELV